MLVPVPVFVLALVLLPVLVFVLVLLPVPVFMLVFVLVLLPVPVFVLMFVPVLVFCAGVLCWCLCWCWCRCFVPLPCQCRSLCQCWFQCRRLSWPPLALAHPPPPGRGGLRSLAQPGMSRGRLCEPQLGLARGHEQHVLQALELKYFAAINVSNESSRYI